VLGGLIGLGGAEFRLPLLCGIFTLVAPQVVGLTLLVNLATVLASISISGELVRKAWAFKWVRITRGFGPKSKPIGTNWP
jgi:DMSO reductase anchor subunit